MLIPSKAGLNSCRVGTATQTLLLGSEMLETAMGNNNQRCQPTHNSWRWLWSINLSHTQILKLTSQLTTALCIQRYQHYYGAWIGCFSLSCGSCGSCGKRSCAQVFMNRSQKLILLEFKVPSLAKQRLWGRTVLRRCTHLPEKTSQRLVEVGWCCEHSRNDSFETDLQKWEPATTSAHRVSTEMGMRLNLGGLTAGLKSNCGNQWDYGNGGA